MFEQGKTFFSETQIMTARIGIVQCLFAGTDASVQFSAAVRIGYRIIFRLRDTCGSCDPFDKTCR